ncbi:MAG: response regulator, partial [Bacteroidetes bacterium]|nr:response regulator [Bacteroidota bacterium]
MSAAGNILVVEDEDKLRGLLRRIIALEGYAVHEASDCKSAWKVLGREDIDVVVCDIHLPDGNGLDLTSQIRDKSSDVEIILLTAHANISDVVKAMRSGAFDYISKGDDNDKLLPLIARAIEKTRLQQRVRSLQQQVKHAFNAGKLFYPAVLGQAEQASDRHEQGVPPGAGAPALEREYTRVEELDR